MALNSRRMQTFFNEFIISTTNFLNQFMTDCETKFFEFERKLNRIENNLVIIEAKLASVPLEQESPTAQPQNLQTKTSIEVPSETLPDLPNVQNLSTTNQSITQTDILQPSDVIAVPTEQPEKSNMIKVSESFLYKKYFKMLKFGVPEQGVRNKMFSEGLDGNLIADSNFMIEKCPEDDAVVEE